MIETRFKDTEVGRIPEDWKLMPIGQLAKDMADGPFGSNLKTEHYTTDKQVRIIQLGNVGDCGWLDENIKYTTFEHAKTLSRCIATPGCILVAKMMPAGRAIVCPSEEKQYILGSDVVRITPNELLVASYFVFQSKSEIYLNQIAANTQGSTRQRTSISKLRNILIPLPNNKHEEIRIATALSNIDALISELGKLIEKKRAIKQGAMQQLLTGKKRLKGFSEPWVEKKLGDCILFLRTGLNPRIHFKLNTTDADCFYITVRELQGFDIVVDEQTDKINHQAVERIDERSRLKIGDVLFSGTGTIGQTALVKEEPKNWGIKEGIYAITPNSKTLDSSFLIYYLHTLEAISSYSSMSSGSTINSVPMAKLLSLPIPLPSLDEQSTIASVLSSMDEEISALEAKRGKYTAIKQGMMQQLLTGKIRLVETTAKPNVTSANVYFRRSVLAAEIADRLCDEPTFGHVKMEKILFLSERLCHIDIGSHYHRDAAGPYDNNALRSIDSQLKKQKWFEVKRTEKGNRYVPMQNRGKHKTYFSRYYSDVLPTFDKIVDTFKSQRTEQCEIVATLYSAWEDLLHGNKPFTDSDIVNEVLNNWHESKKRISQDRWIKAILWMRENGFAPDKNNN